MNGGPRLSLVTQLFDEEHFLPKLLAGLRATSPTSGGPHKVMLLDDGRRDSYADAL
jgi:hypothetical protein